jgi:hypothetical protein
MEPRIPEDTNAAIAPALGLGNTQWEDAGERENDALETVKPE